MRVYFPAEVSPWVWDNNGTDCLHWQCSTVLNASTMLPVVAFPTIFVPLAMIWKLIGNPCASILRAAGLLSPPAVVPDIDLTGRVAIVTGANTGRRCLSISPLPVSVNLSIALLDLFLSLYVYVCVSPWYPSFGLRSSLASALRPNLCSPPSSKFRQKVT